jgi:hypothetical protein
MSKKRLSLLVFSFLFAYFSLFQAIAQAATVITTCDGLQAMNTDLTADYELGADIDCTSATRVGGTLWNDEAGFVPVGVGNGSSSTTTFMGTFDGKGYTITGLYINSKDGMYGGLFGSIGKLGEVEPVVRNVNLVDVEIVNVDLYGGGAVGLINYMGKVERVSVTGTINGRRYIGGVVGWNNRGKIFESSSDVAISRVTASSTGYAVDSVGGIVGDSTLGEIRDCYAQGSISLEALDDITYIGGLIGYMDRGSLKNSYADVPIQIVGGPWVEGVGGLIGYHDDGTVYSSYSTGLVTASGSSLDSIGGFVGYTYGVYDNVGYFVQGAFPAIGFDDTAGASITYQEDAVAAFYPSSHLIYSDADSTWNFDTIWLQRASALPILAYQADSGGASDEEAPAEDEQAAADNSSPNQQSSSSTSSSSSSKPASCHKSTPTHAATLFQINVAGSSAKLYFTPVSGAVNKYYVSFAQQSQTLQHGFWVEANNDNQGVQVVDVFLLQPYSNYYFRVRPYNDCAPGEWSNEMKIQTTRLTDASKIFYMHQNAVQNQARVTTSSSKQEPSNLVEQMPDASVSPAPTAKNDSTSVKTETKQETKTEEQKKTCFLWWCW